MMVNGKMIKWMGEEVSQQKMEKNMKLNVQIIRLFES